MTDNLTIRAARPANAPCLKNLSVLGWETTYAGFLRPENHARY